MEQVHYNFFRPKNLSHIVGQKIIKEIIISMLENGNFFPVIVFSGTHGTGKTSIARILSKVLNCDKYNKYQELKKKLKEEGDKKNYNNPCEICSKNTKNSEKNKTIVCTCSQEKVLDNNFFENKLPCEKCNACILIEENRALDVLEVDAATYTGVENTRNIIEGVYHMPIQFKKKIVIIDEVHMLSKGAFNSLLKTLEEPPEYVVFFFLTTEESKIPDTVLSRALTLRTQTITKIEMIPFLERIDQELKKRDGKKLFHPEILDLIEQYAKGSLRDGLVAFETVCNLKNQDIKSVTRALSSCTLEEVVPVYSYVLDGHLKEAIELWKSMEASGVSSINFLKLLIKILGQALKHKMSVEIFKSPYEFFHNISKISNNVLIRHYEIILYQITNSDVSQEMLVEITLIMLSTIIEEDINHAIDNLSNVSEQWSQKKFEQ